MKYLPFGFRTFKTALAVTLAVLLVRLISEDVDAVFYGAMGAMIAMDTTLDKSLRQGLTQFLSVIFGTLMGYLALTLFPAVPAWFYGLGILLLILLCNSLKFPYTITLSGIIFLSACSYPTESLWGDAIERIACTGFGLLLALIINVTLRPYNNKKRLRNQIRRLQQEVPKALEQMVIREQFPDLQPFVQQLRQLDGEIAVYHSQRFFHRKHDREALYRGCCQLCQRMVQELEMICSMDSLGDLAQDNRRRMEKLGIWVPDLRPRKCTRQDTIVMNYHIDKLLTAYDYLNELLEE